MNALAQLDWRTFSILVIAGALGGVAVLPYTLQLQADRIPELPMPLPMLALVTLGQGLVLMAVIVGLGMWAASTQNLRIGSVMTVLPMAIGVGVLAGVAIVGLERLVFQPFLPEALRDGAVTIPTWKRFLASFYGGITEELLLRLFLLSVLGFLLSRFWGQPMWVLWTANIVAALVFGLLHLPAVAALTPLTPIVVFRTVVLNMVGGLMFGGLFIHYGLLAAIIAHFSADIMLHIVTVEIVSRWGS
jgi:hypothetical protein